MNILYTEEEFKNAKSRQLMPLKCGQCNKIFYKTKNYIKTQIKNRPINNCSIQCYGIENRKNKKEFLVSCFRCGNTVKVLEKEDSFPSKEKYYCSVYCRNKRKHSQETKNKISQSLSGRKLPSKTKGKEIVKKVITLCVICNKEILDYARKHRKCCSRLCSSFIAGKKSAEKRCSRSKNEILFAEMCRNKFGEILTNKSIFNGWDADIIIPSLKIAILWNGKWHYEYIRGNQSLKQIQNRDKIKILEIEKAGYIPYIIQDMGKYKIKKVEEEFKKFLDIYDAGLRSGSSVES